MLAAALVSVVTTSLSPSLASTNASLDISAGPALVAGTFNGGEANASSLVVVGGPGLGISIRATGDVMFAMVSADFAVPAVVAPLTLTLTDAPRLRKPSELMGDITIGLGVPFVNNDVVSAGLALTAFIATMPYDCDCAGDEIDFGIAPHAFASWWLTPTFGLSTRAQAVLGSESLTSRSSRGPFVQLLFTSEATWRFGSR